MGTLLNRYSRIVCGIAIALIAQSSLAENASKKSKPNLDKDPTLYIVGYAHLDTQWLWMYPVVIGDYIKNTMEDNFKLFDKYPHYTFNFTGSNRYRLMKEYYPEDYAKLKKYVAEGRWFPAGSSIEEGDVNSPSLESLVRHVMYGNEFFQKEFGKTSTEYMLPDCFGFPAALPSILAHCGLKGFSTQKLTWGSAAMAPPGEKPFAIPGIPFNLGVWTGPDGRGIVAALNPGSYGSNVTDNLTEDQDWLKRVEEDGQESGVYADYHYFGTGDVGGGPSDQTVSWVEKTLTSNGPLNVVGGDADQLFNDLTPEEVAKLPRYKGDLELTQHSAGSITSEAEMKRWNHQNEKLAQAAEETNVASTLLGAGTYPMDKLMSAWNLFLTCQFHDMMAGTARPLAYTYAWNDECLAMNEFASALTSGVGAISKGLNTRGPGIPLLVYNPLSFARVDPVEATLAIDGSHGLSVTGPTGQTVPAQVLSYANGKSRFVFLAGAPSVGLAVYHAHSANVHQMDKASDLSINGHMIENSKLRVTVGADGNVTSVFDKVNHREVLSAPIRLAFMAEAPTQYPAWNMNWKDQKLPPYAYVDGPAKITVAENGPVRCAIQIERDAQGSHFVQQVRLSSGSDRVEFLDTIDWKTTGCVLKASFPLVAANPEATYNWQVGTIERGNNDPKKFEVAAHRWFDLTDQSGKFGCTVLSGSKNGSDKPSDDVLRLTLLYSPKPTSDFAEQAYQDWGHHEILYGLEPHASDWRAAQSPRMAMRLDQPMAVFTTTQHPAAVSLNGRLGGGMLSQTAFSLLDLSSNHVSVVAVKRAEANGNVIVRFREDNGVAASNVNLRFGEGIASAVEVDGQERRIGPATVNDGKLVFNMPPYYVKAFELTLRKPTVTVSPTMSETVALPYNQDVISSRNNRSDGDFDGHGRTLAADQLPDSLRDDSIGFAFGPKADGQKNAVSCEGQTIQLPSGHWQRVYLLAASANGDRSATFRVGNSSKTLTVQDWGGHIGEWDTRVWAHPQADPIYNWGDNAYEGLIPAFMKMAPVAWACDHKHDPQGDEIYEYSYLFKYGMDIPAGSHSITLPNDPAIKVLAVSVARNEDDDLQPADPLYDTLPRKQDAPLVSPFAGSFSDSIKVSIAPHMYGTEKDIRYSLDGSEPTLPYSGPFWVSSKSEIKARIGDGPFAVVSLYVNDTTPPKVVSSSYWKNLQSVELHFSEPIDKSMAEMTSSYTLSSGSVVSAKLSEDGQSVMLKTTGVSTDGPLTIKVDAEDVSPNRNRTTAEVTPTAYAPVYSLDSFTCDGQEYSQVVPDLPVRGDEPWTMNFSIKMHRLPDDHTALIGFGQVADDVDGAGRYICEFAQGGIRFWGRNVDIPAGAQFKLNTWQMMTVTYDGNRARLYRDGKLLASSEAIFSDAPPVVRIAPLDGWEGRHRFSTGWISNFTIWNSCLDPSAIQGLLAGNPTGS